MCHDSLVPTPIVVLFYLWLAVSVVLLIHRLATRNRRQSRTVRSTAQQPTIPLDWAPPDATPASAPPTPSARPEPVPGTTAPPPTAPPPTPARTDMPRPGAGSSTLMEALAGITLPCDLMPLTTAEGRVLSGRDLLLITNGHSAFEVGRSLGESMGALGYALTPMANNDFVALRGNDRINVVVHDRPEGLLSGKRLEFPTAKPGDVIVELRL